MINFKLKGISKIKALIKYWKYNKDKNKNNRKINIVIKKGKCIINE